MQRFFFIFSFISLNEKTRKCELSGVVSSGKRYEEHDDLDYNQAVG
jgi:hypothetical protein